MKKFTRRIVSLLLVLTFILGIIPFNISKAATDENKSEPLLFGYYRVWHDRMNGKKVRGEKDGDKKGIQNFGDLPEELDVAFLFVDWIDDNLGYRKNPFWNELPSYVKKLHEKNIKVVRTIDISLVVNTSTVPVDGELPKNQKTKRYFNNDNEGHRKLAKLIVDEYVTRDKLDGLDIDMEWHNFNENQLSMAVGVIKEISKILKSQGKLFIYDTDKTGNKEIFQKTGDLYDYVLYQSYRNENLDYIYSTFSNKIPVNKFVPGFSFYEENDSNRWYNLSGSSLDKTEAYQLTTWQPKDKNLGTKGGVFAFAVERSGVKDGQDAIIPADYSVLKKLDSYLHQSHKSRLNEIEKNSHQRLEDVKKIENKDMIPFAGWTNGSDYAKKFNDGKIGGNDKWTDWKRTDRLEKNYVGLVFGSPSDVREIKLDSLDIHFFMDGGTAYPKKYEVQVYTGNKLDSIPDNYGFTETTVDGKKLDNDLNKEENWKTVKISEKPVSKDTIKFENIKTKAIRLKMEAQSGKSLAMSELVVKGTPVKNIPIKYTLSNEEVTKQIKSLEYLSKARSTGDFIAKIGTRTNEQLLKEAKKANDVLKRLETEALPKKPALPELKAPLYGGWFRTWHDQYSDIDENRPNYFGNMPKEVDLAFVFHDGTKDYSEFWEKLAYEYVPKMNARGQRVLRTIGINALFKNWLKDENGNEFSYDDEGALKRAKYIVENQINRYGLDGIDIDIEYHDTYSNRSSFTPDMERYATKVLSHIADLIKAENKIFMVDTNMSGEQAILKTIYNKVDYFMLQAYGSGGQYGIQSKWNTYHKYGIKPEQFILGFSFYEEGDGNRWNDISDSVEKSRAEYYAKWNPAEGKKAGLVSYAIDRDGVKFGDDSIKPTKYELSKQLKRVMEYSDVEDEIKEIQSLKNLSKEEINKYVDRLNNGLKNGEKLLPYEIVNLAKKAELNKEKNTKKINPKYEVEVSNKKKNDKSDKKVIKLENNINKNGGNPKTSDSGILLYVAVTAISIIGLSVVRKKND